MEDNTTPNVQEQKKKETQRFHKYLKDGEAQLKDSDRRIVSHNLFDILQELTDQGMLKTKSDVDKIGGSHRLPRFALSRALSDEEFNKRAKDNNLTRKWTGYYTVISEAAEKIGKDKDYYLLELFEGTERLESFRSDNEGIFPSHVEFLYDLLTESGRKIINTTGISDYYAELAERPVYVDLLTGGDFCVGGYQVRIEEFIHQYAKVMDAGPTLLPYSPLYTAKQGEGDKGVLFVSRISINKSDRTPDTGFEIGLQKPTTRWFHPVMGIQTECFIETGLVSTGMTEFNPFGEEKPEDLFALDVEVMHIAEVGLTVFPIGRHMKPVLGFYVRQKTEIWCDDKILNLSTDFWNDYCCPIYYLQGENGDLCKTLFVSEKGHANFPWTNVDDPFNMENVTPDASQLLQGDWVYYEEVTLATVNKRLNIAPKVEKSILLRQSEIDLDCPPNTLGAIAEASLLEGDPQFDCADQLMRAAKKKIESFRNYKDRMHLLKKQKLKKFKEKWKAD